MTQYHFITSCSDNHGNGGIFNNILNIMYNAQSPRHVRTWPWAPADFSKYCFDNMHGLVDVKHSFNSFGEFCEAELIFKDEASFSWFILKWMKL